MIALPTPQEVMHLYDYVQQRWDIPVEGVRDPLMLELVCARPVLAQADNVPDAVAMVVEGLLNNQPFRHANQAVVLATLQVALAMNGWRLACSPTALQRAFSDWRKLPLDYRDVADWLRLAVEPI